MTLFTRKENEGFDNTLFMSKASVLELMIVIRQAIANRSTDGYMVQRYKTGIHIDNMDVEGWQDIMNPVLNKLIALYNSYGTMDSDIIHELFEKIFENRFKNWKVDKKIATLTLDFASRRNLPELVKNLENKVKSHMKTICNYHTQGSNIMKMESDFVKLIELMGYSVHQNSETYRYSYHTNNSLFDRVSNVIDNIREATNKMRELNMSDNSSQPQQTSNSNDNTNVTNDNVEVKGIKSKRKQEYRRIKGKKEKAIEQVLPTLEGAQPIPSGSWLKEIDGVRRIFWVVNGNWVEWHPTVTGSPWSDLFKKEEQEKDVKESQCVPVKRNKVVDDVDNDVVHTGEDVADDDF